MTDEVAPPEQVKKRGRKKSLKTATNENTNKRRERNRKSAKDSRHRKKIYMEQLEIENRRLLEENKMLQ